MFKKLWIRVLLFCAIAFTASIFTAAPASADEQIVDCDDYDVVELEQDGDVITLAKGKTTTLELYDASYVKTATWTSSDTSVAKVSSSGKVTAKGYGTATINVNGKDLYGNSFSGSATVMVSTPKLSATSMNLSIYNTDKDSDGYYHPANNLLTIEKIYYESSVTITSSSKNLKVANIWYLTDEVREIYLYPQKAGTYTLTITVDGKKMTCPVTVSKMYFSRNSKTVADGNSSTWVEGYSTLALYKGETTTLKVKSAPSGSKIKWSSSDTSVAKVDSSGKVTAKGLGGATITAKCGDYTITYEVAVSYKKAIKALRYCIKNYTSAYSQEKRMETGYYDCSSLVWRAYDSAGVHVGSDSYAPTAAAMAQWCAENGYMMYEGTANFSDLLPGDLIFDCNNSESSNGRFNGIYHVDMYQGNGATITVAGVGGQQFYLSSGKLYGVMIARPCGLKPSSLKLTASSSGVKVSWGSVHGASKYQVYRSTSKSGTYKKVATVSGKSWTDTTVTANKTYYYKVRAKFTSNETYYGKYTSAKSVTAKKVTKLPATTLKLKSNSGGTIKLSWSKVSGASGYVIYRSTSKDGTYKKCKTITSGKTTSYTKKGLTSGKTYYYKIKAYKKSGDKKKMGTASKALKVKVK